MRISLPVCMTTQNLIGASKLRPLVMYSGPTSSHGLHHFFFKVKKNVPRVEMWLKTHIIVAKGGKIHNLALR